MFKSFIIENAYGEKIEFANNSQFELLSVTGLNPVAAEISSNVVPGVDGARLGIRRIGMRNIVILLRIKQPVSQNREYLYEHITTNDSVKITIDKGNQPVTISGVVETFENDIFTQSQQPMISILCSDPYFYADEVMVDFKSSVENLIFPISFPSNGVEFTTVVTNDNAETNAGNCSVGVTVTVKVGKSTVHGFNIKNITTGEVMSVDRDLSAGDVLEVCTIQGKKKATIRRSGEVINVVQFVDNFLTLKPGKNKLKYWTNDYSTDIECEVRYTRRYGGI